MSDFSQEFGFLPPELIFKSHEFVRAYHKVRGSGWLFVRKSLIRADRSPYLSHLGRRAVGKGKILRGALACALISAIAAFIWSGWFLVACVLSILISFLMVRRIEFDLVQQRALIIAMEMLSIDFAGWGTLFPSAMQDAQRWLKSIAFGIEGTLLDVYMPSGERIHFVDTFRPSAGSIARAGAND